MSHKKNKYASYFPFIAAMLYMLGLFFLVGDRFIFGFIFIAAGIVTGIYAAIKAFRASYKPVRHSKSRLAAFVDHLRSLLSRERS
ncbi:MAG: hypothetical protein U9R44_03500 [Candidatus Omnitrophota bacterium]|nr:hypothetical protein [Candidatus Omnitrophota bacterium]